MPIEKLARSLFKAMKTAKDRRGSRLRVRAGTARSPNPTIYFLTPDFNEPSGGIRVIYRHVDILNSAGINALVLHQRRGFRCNWFENQTRITDAASATLLRGDILVMPEILVDVLERIPCRVRYVIFNQGVHLSWSGVSRRVADYYTPGRGLLGVITVSEHSEAMLRYAFGGIDVRRIHIGIDAGLFHPHGSQRANRIAYMPRRMPEDAHQVLQIARNRGLLEGWEIVELDGMTQAEVAAQLRTTKIFLAFTYQEGFGLPPAEAMACGNYVIGYHGFGGRELFQQEFSVPVETGDIVGYVKALEHAVNNERIHPGWCQAKGALSSEFVTKKYSVEKEMEDVRRNYLDFLVESGKRLSAVPREHEQNIRKIA